IKPGDKLGALYRMDGILGLGLDSPEQEKEEETAIPHQILALVEERLKAKREKNYHRADELRAIVEKAGYKLTDTPGTTQVSKTL
ncbi:MAG: cysteine--tRNA ligase, partial [Sphaerochaetaceae bacterium]|nr:cysteine--tRNA ligase [Sphaerochaetaceae bacterium]